MAQEKDNFLYPDSLRPDCGDGNKLVNLGTLSVFGRKILDISRTNDKIVKDSLDGFVEDTNKKLGTLPPKVDRFGNVIKDKEGNLIPVASSLVEYVDMNDRRTYDIIHSEVISQREIDGMFPTDFVKAIKEGR